jgi:transposase
VLRFRLMVKNEVRVYGLKHQKEKRSMDHFAGLDVSVKETSVCIVDDTGKIVREVKVASEPEALLALLKNPAYHFKRIGLEAGPLSQWLFSALAEAELPVVCVETRHMQAVLKAQINKTDRNDARGIAQMMRVGLYRPVHVKTLRSQKLRMLLTHRKLLQSKAIATTGPTPGIVIKRRHTSSSRTMASKRRCATVDVPARFRKSKTVGAVFGLTYSKYQSGEIDRSGRISRCGDEMMQFRWTREQAAAAA